MEAFLRNCAAQGKKADLIFMDLDKTMYASCYELIIQEGLLAEGGVLVCDNVLYRGLSAQKHAGEMPAVSAKTAANAEGMDAFLQLVRKDMHARRFHSLMLPVRDGMLAMKMATEDDAAMSYASTTSSEGAPISEMRVA